MSSMPSVATNSWDKARPLKYEHGDEKSHSVVVDRDTVPANDNGQRFVTGGSLLCEITATGLYGPYDKNASDGRESLAEEKCVITRRGLNVTLYNRAVAGFFADCVFDKSELTLHGVSLHGASLTSLKSAFPQCTFSD
jgi:hypothetical protein